MFRLPIPLIVANALLKPAVFASRKFFADRANANFKSGAKGAATPFVEAVANEDRATWTEFTLQVAESGTAAKSSKIGLKIVINNVAQIGLPRLPLKTMKLTGSQSGSISTPAMHHDWHAASVIEEQIWQRECALPHQRPRVASVWLH